MTQPAHTPLPQAITGASRRPPQRRAIATAALLALVAGSALAQDKVCDGIVKIGMLTDLSGVYTDIVGPAR